MKKHKNIPIFIPHEGCPNQCVFCNQRSISGVTRFDPTTVDAEIREALSTISSDTECEIAFFGGSFTGIDRNLMVYLLSVAYEYVKAGRVSSIRCSTRPDYINEDILDILWNYGVRTVELGLQSVSERVLSISGRGHGFAEEAQAVKLITERGFALVGQMMIGLPGASYEDEIRTAEFIVKSGAGAARIYPTVVFRDTPLCSMAQRGEYQPLSENEAIRRSLGAFRILHRGGVDVIRIGLSASENLSGDAYYAGPNHSALGELVINEFYYENIKQKCYLLFQNKESRGAILTIFVAPGSVSRAVGQRRKNIIRLTDVFGFARIRVAEDVQLSELDIRLSVEGEIRCI